MTYAYNSKIYLAEAVLNVKDLARQTAFHTQILGLEILSQTEEEVLLGAGGKPLVHLIQTDRTGLRSCPALDRKWNWKPD